MGAHGSSDRPRGQLDRVSIGAATVLGLALAWIDSGPRWDDTGIIVMSLLVGCVLIGARLPARPMLCAVMAGIWIPLFHLVEGGDWSSAPALVVAVLGVYGGVAARRSLDSGPPAPRPLR